MTPAQRASVAELIHSLRPRVLNHGGCVGADEQVHGVAVYLGVDVHVYPCNIRNKRGVLVGEYTEHEARPPLHRNGTIVALSGVLIAAPKSLVEELRSGTWATVRRARNMSVPVLIVQPDGLMRWDDGGVR